MSGNTWPALRTASEVVTATAAEASARDTIELAARIAGVLTIAACTVALVVRVAAAAAARHWLKFPFTGVPARPGEAAAIFLHNFRALVAVAGLLLIAQSRYWVAKTNGGRLHRAIQRAGEALLAAGVAVNVAVVGASLGACGERMIRAILPHGPVELAAYALALALYLQGRERPLSARHVLGIAGLSISMLALAAALETFVTA